MKSLAERHADRAQRKADNAVESDLNGSTGGLGLALVAIDAANDAIRSLTPEQREELHAIAGEAMAEAADSGFEPDGFEMAGIGVVNPLVTATGQYNDLANTAAQNGELPAPSFDPENGNISGQSIESQTGNGGGNGWGSGGNADDDDDADKPKPVKASMSVADLEAIAAEEGADLTGVTNNDGRVEAIEANRKAKAEA